VKSLNWGFRKDGPKFGEARVKVNPTLKPDLGKNFWGKTQSSPRVRTGGKGRRKNRARERAVRPRVRGGVESEIQVGAKKKRGKLTRRSLQGKWNLSFINPGGPRRKKKSCWGKKGGIGLDETGMGGTERARTKPEEQRRPETY